MIYVLTGNDRNAILEKTKGIIDSLGEGVHVYRRDPDTWNERDFQEITESEALFGGVSVVVCDGLLGDPTSREVVLSRISRLAESAHHIILREPTLEEEVRGVFVKEKVRIESYVGKEVRFEAPNVFPLADALGNKDRKSAWLVFQALVRTGVSPEELLPTLIWKVRAMWTAKRGGTAKDLGMKDFPFNKALQDAQGWQEKELRNLSFALLGLYHNARRGKAVIALELERLLLSLSK